MTISPQELKETCARLLKFCEENRKVVSGREMTKAGDKNSPFVITVHSLYEDVSRLLDAIDELQKRAGAGRNLRDEVSKLMIDDIPMRKHIQLVEEYDEACK